MAKCPYEIGGTEQHAYCQKFRDATGFGCGVLRAVECKQHMAAGGWDVPLEEVPEFPAQIRARIIGRLLHGDCPMYQGPNPIDIVAAANRLKALLSEDDRRVLLHEVADKWSELSNVSGGHPAEVVEEKLRQLARTWNLESELDRWAARLIP